MTNSLKSSWGKRLGERHHRPEGDCPERVNLPDRLTVKVFEAARFRVVGMGRQAKQVSDWIEREQKNQTWRERQNVTD